MGSKGQVGDQAYPLTSSGREAAKYRQVPAIVRRFTHPFLLLPFPFCFCLSAFPFSLPLLMSSLMTTKRLSRLRIAITASGDTL